MLSAARHLLCAHGRFFARSPAALALVLPTVASRLFPRDPLAEHLGSRVEASVVMPVPRLVAPHQFEVLPQARGAIDLHGANGPPAGARGHSCRPVDQGATGATGVHISLKAPFSGA